MLSMHGSSIILPRLDVEQPVLHVGAGQVVRAAVAGANALAVDQCPLHDGPLPLREVHHAEGVHVAQARLREVEETQKQIQLVHHIFPLFHTIPLL